MQFPSLVLAHWAFSSQLGGPFDFCAFASLSELLLGSLEIALKCTRPRQRFWFMLGEILRPRAGCVKGKYDKLLKKPHLIEDATRSSLEQSF